MVKHLRTKIINTDKTYHWLLNLNRIVAIHNTENIASGKVMIKNNMKYKGTLKQVGKLNGNFYDLNIYSILKSEWKS